MHANPVRNISLGLGAAAIIGTLWLLLVPDQTIAVRSSAALSPCSGEMGRFQMAVRAPKHVYMLDTCTGEVWALISSPDKLEPGAWALMDRYDTRDQVARLFEYLRGETEERGTDEQQYQEQDTDQQQYQEQGQDTDQQYPIEDEPQYQEGDQEDQAADQQDQGDEQQYRDGDERQRTDEQRAEPDQQY